MEIILFFIAWFVEKLVAVFESFFSSGLLQSSAVEPSVADRAKLDDREHVFMLYNGGGD